MAYPNAKQLYSINILIDMCLINKVILMWCGMHVYMERQNSGIDYIATPFECGLSKRLYIFSCYVQSIPDQNLQKGLFLVYLRYVNYINKLCQ